MQVFLEAYHTPAGDQNRASKVLYVSEHKTKYILIHAPYTRTVFFDILVTYTKDFIESNLLLYPHVLYSSNICEMLLYNQQLLVLTHKLIYIFRLLTTRGK